MTTVTTCPTCSAEVPVDTWPSWCEKCNWGIVASRARPPRGRVDALLQDIGSRSGERTERRMIGLDELRPRWTAARIAAYAIALLVHLVTLGLVCLGVFLIVTAYRNPFADILAGVLIIMAWLMRPRVSRLEETDLVVLEDVAPTLYQLVGRVAHALEVPRPDVMVIDSDWNAAVHNVGYRQRTVLWLGLPLFTALGPEERVALIAHELGHLRNGDARRGLVVGSAVDALVELYLTLRPERAETILDWAHIVASWVLSRPVLWLLHLELHLLLRDSRRAEYLADARAAQVAGTAAAVSLSELILLGPAFEAIVARNVQRLRGGDTSVFAELAVAVASVTPRERDRRRRIARLEGSRLDATHPPTASRIAVLERRPPIGPMVVLDPDSSAAIDHELARFRQEVSSRVIDDHRDRLYW